MCVTNTTYRRSQPISLPQRQQQAVAAPQPPQESQQQQQLSSSVSGLTQRLLSTYQLAAAQQQNGGFVFGGQQVDQSSPEFCVAPPEKPRPKRRRKPQKPGKTAKMNDRHFVVHNYHDHAQDPVDSVDTEEQGCSSCGPQHHDDSSHSTPHRRKGGVAVAFPLKLHAVLDQVEADGLSHVISWQPHGRCFVIHNPKEFTDHVMPKYFRQTKLTSFQRQLNLYGFCRLTRGPDASGYYHELFLKGKTHLCKRMTRTKVKGTKFKAASSPEQEPDFYKMPAVTVSSGASSSHHQHVTPPTTSDEEMSHDSSSLRSHTSTVVQQQAAPTSFFFQQPNMEPLPIQFASSTSVQAPPPPMQYSPVAASIPPPPVPTSFSWGLSTADTDQVLDEAVDELFLQEATSSTTSDELADFCQDWDPSNNAFAETLENDKQLGYMLEKLLED